MQRTLQARSNVFIFNFIFKLLFAVLSLLFFFFLPANAVPPKLAARRPELRGYRQICLLAHVAHAALGVMRVDTQGQQNIAAEPNTMDQRHVQLGAPSFGPNSKSLEAFVTTTTTTTCSASCLASSTCWAQWDRGIREYLRLYMRVLDGRFKIHGLFFFKRLVFVFRAR